MEANIELLRHLAQIHRPVDSDADDIWHYMILNMEEDALDPPALQAVASALESETNQGIGFREIQFERVLEHPELVEMEYYETNLVCPRESLAAHIRKILLLYDAGMEA
ncbi:MULTISPECIES: hypothetical protein [Paenibacillus]|uniref:hypothetical protein n=1 Tax=Paenibacillus TaxID=44249 RepID=UPI00020D6F84|nr:MULTISPECIES: hypothetical protein [Paenibacillus]EGL15195.1 hypothetical protein HMPREF9413_3231 [Paenibacillus sp. HGF7]EPD89612.1 hypothetical protein HMPREF1207_01461 [Paenibacillus sp. HGH0039]MBV6712211.1 hypothetical protein [Paenibacillus chitinolyticus]MEC0249386.1 hypothetical protein [Paenibacillus chitinolyticus]